MNSLEPEILLDSFKIALLKQDSQQAFLLIERLSLEQLQHLDLDTLLSLKEMIAQSIELLKKERDTLQLQMAKAKKIQKFLS
ncbi:hypothetical protein [Helicobacter cetorum]|uniref:Uncharacterized protein n=1 Tax=Helicobacter cetorum (strain ATCC BAA-540 / CCUG 52418 / MIT 99-5656) TaxID=1163745 RepID=I0ETV8_HELCM|nr:hypothetical protein [Helicobacter cetorum]AFI06377.1 hypothetical protein HCD_06890 [Helicobacter cetorum MIT 99-5656]